MQDEMREKNEANELPKDPEKEKRKFVDEMFGRDFPADSKLLVDRSLAEKFEEQKVLAAAKG